VCRERVAVPSRHRGEPEITAVGEDDLVPVDVGEAEELWSGGGGWDENGEQETEGQRDAIHTWSLQVWR
jgi:hypothetical protein